MTTQTTPRSAVVADRRPIVRNLVRFLLEEKGYVVAAEAGTPRDAARAAAEHRPDVVIVHDSCTAEDGTSILPEIRTSSPSTTVVVVTASRVSLPSELVEAADAVVEEGAGLKELGFALGGSSVVGSAVKESSDVPAPAPATVVGPSGPPPRSRRWFERAQGAAAASIILLAIVVASRLEPGPPPSPATLGPPSVLLSDARRALETLHEHLPQATPAEAASLARALLAERAIALAGGADVSALDRAIAELIGPLLGSLPPATADAIVAILGGLVEIDGAPTPTPSPEPSLTPSPGPGAEPTEGPPTEASVTEPPPTGGTTPPPTETVTPSQTPSPEPTETPSPTPTETQTPSPTPSQTPPPQPSPTETESPSPAESSSPTQSHSPGPPFDPPGPPFDPPGPPSVPPGQQSPTVGGLVVVIPSGIGALLASAGVARRLGRRRHDPS